MTDQSLRSVAEAVLHELTASGASLVVGGGPRVGVKRKAALLDTFLVREEAAAAPAGVTTWSTQPAFLCLSCDEKIDLIRRVEEAPHDPDAAQRRFRLADHVWRHYEAELKSTQNLRTVAENMAPLDPNRERAFAKLNGLLLTTPTALSSADALACIEHASGTHPDLFRRACAMFWKMGSATHPDGTRVPDQVHLTREFKNWEAEHKHRLLVAVMALPGSDSPL